MADFSTRGSMALIAGDTVLSVIASATVRPQIQEVLVSGISAPQDYNAEFHLARGTADGTGTSVTPQKVDPATPAAVATSKHTYTVEPTYTANDIPLQMGCHQRNTVRWVCQDGREIKLAATAGVVAGLLCNAVSTAWTAAVTIFFRE